MTTLAKVAPGNLNVLMEFDHVIRVHPDGTVSEPSNVWAPELWDEELFVYPQIPSQPSGWWLMNGYSAHSGPIMHDSEFIGGRMARNILTQPGLYVALTNHTSEPSEGCDDCTEDPCDQHDIAGWAVAYIEDEEE